MGSRSPSPPPRRSARLSAAAARAADLNCSLCGNEYSVAGFGEGNKHGTDHRIFGQFPSCNGDNYSRTGCRAPYTHTCGQKLCHNCWSKHRVCVRCLVSIEPAPDQIEQPSVLPFAILLGIFIATQLPSGIISQIQSLSGFAFIILMFLFWAGS